MSATLIISQREAEELLTMEACVPAMSQTLRAISAGETALLQRSMLPQLKGNKFAIMASSDLSQKLCGAKVIVFPGQEAKENHTNQGIIPLFDSETASLLAIVDAECITGVRTAATSAAATDVLARKDAHVLAILGAGRIGRMHMDAIRLVRPIDTVMVWDRTPEATEACCRLAREKFGWTAIPCATAEEAARPADIICTVTQAKEPVLEGAWLKSGAHINAVGACTPAARELDTEAVVRSRIYVDLREAALRDGGDLVIPMQAGDLQESQVVGEVGQVLLGRLPGRQNDEEITLFESVGIAVEDLSAAALIYRLAQERGMGTAVEI